MALARIEIMTKPCTIDGCDNPLYAKQICKNHYELKRRRGRIYKIRESLPRGSSSQERLIKYSKYNTENGCLEWMGALTPDGYAQIKVNKNKNTKIAHRLSWEIHNNRSAKGFLIMHSCDNRKCINPEHLVLGNHKLNMQDMTSKNRQAKGSSHANAKLDEKKVIEIHKMLNAGVSQTSIAKMYNVRQSTISCIKLGKVWRHVRINLWR